MKKFIITEEQLQTIANVLLEIPAKVSLAALDVLRSLIEHKVEELEKTPPANS